MPLRSITGFLILINLACFSQSDHYFFKSYSISDGLPNNHVRWMTQDRDGFLWLATWDGLARFDGVEFKVYRHNPSDSNSVAFFEIVKVVVDSANHVWVFAGGSLCRLDRRTDHFKIFDERNFPHLDSEWIDPAFSDLVIDRSGHLIVVYSNGFYRFNNSSEKFEYIQGQIKPIQIFNPSLSSIDNEGNLWYLKLTYDQDFGKAVRCRFDQMQNISSIDSFSIEMKPFQTLLLNESCHVHYNISPAGQVWLTSTQGLMILEKDTFRLARNDIPLLDFPDADHLIWSQQDQGLMIYYPLTHKIDTLFKPKEDQKIIAYFLDYQNNIWFDDISDASVNNGITLAFRTGQEFRHYLTGTVNGQSYVIYGLCKDYKGNIWAGGRPNDHIIKITPQGLEYKIPLPFKPISYYCLPRNIITDDSGNIWIAFFHDYLYRFDPMDSVYTDFSNISKYYNNKAWNKNFRLIHQLGKNLMVAVGGGKIHIFNSLTGECNSSPSIDDRDIFCIYNDTNQKIWFGLSGKLFSCDYNLNNQKLYTISERHYNIEDICPGDSDDLWLAMLGGGIGHFDIKSGKTIFYTTYNGLAHNTVYSIRKDHAGNLWVSHNLGISMFNPFTKSFTNYDEKDGLMIKEFDSEASYQTSEGELLFGGIGGVVSFYPEQLKSNLNETPSRLLITEFRIADTVFPMDQPIDKLSMVLLPKGTDNFQLEFVRPDFRNGDETRYRYRLKGSQEDWIMTDWKRRWVNYTSLRPGKYEFQVECTNLKGEWACHRSLDINIPPYFYQTMFFKILCVILVMGLMLLFLFMKLRQNRLKEWRSYEQLKLESLRSQMNPHFISNSLNTIYSFISSDDPDNANRHISKLSRLMRTILNHASVDFISLSSEINSLKDYLGLQQQSYPGKFSFTVNWEGPGDPENVDIMPFLVQPFAENAIKHGLRPLKARKGNLKIIFSLGDDSYVLCEITDDGIGRKQSMINKTQTQKEIKSRGIAIVNERIEIMNSIYRTNFKVTITDLDDKMDDPGTKVMIEIPVRRKDEPSNFNKK